MIAPVAPAALGSPLSRLGHVDREHVIDALVTRLPRDSALSVLTALAGSSEEVAAVPFDVQSSAHEAILASLPPGHNAVVASILGIAMRSDEANLEATLTEEEKADPMFRQRVEEMARDRGIQRWLAAVKLRYERLGPEELVTAVQHRQQDQALSDR